MADKVITKVRIDYEDGTYIELNTPEGCAQWLEMVNTQAMFAFVHGQKYKLLPWTGTGVKST